jgi:putative FmdB family regulatory protein
MPIFVYKCPTCPDAVSTEVIQRASDPEPKCDQCEGTLTKQITAAGFSFKGTGFYCTDYGKSTCNSKTKK